MLLNKDEFNVSPNRPEHTEFVSTCKGFRNIWQEGYYVLHTDLTFSVILNIIPFHCSAFPLVWTDRLILNERLVLRFCQRFWGDTWQQLTYIWSIFFLTCACYRGCTAAILTLPAHQDGWTECKDCSGCQSPCEHLFFNMVYYHGVKTNRKTHLWR